MSGARERLEEPAGAKTIARLMLSLAVTMAACCFFLALGWWRCGQRPVDVEALSTEQRRSLVDELVAVSPGAFVPTLYEPAIGYTLPPGSLVKAWDDEFSANELGFRAPPAAKRPGTFRLLFLGDGGIRLAPPPPTSWA